MINLVHLKLVKQKSGFIINTKCCGKIAKFLIQQFCIIFKLFFEKNYIFQLLKRIWLTVFGLLIFFISVVLPLICIIRMRRMKKRLEREEAERNQGISSSRSMPETRIPYTQNVAPSFSQNMTQNDPPSYWNVVSSPNYVQNGQSSDLGSGAQVQTSKSRKNFLL